MKIIITLLLLLIFITGCAQQPGESSIEERYYPTEQEQKEASSEEFAEAEKEECEKPVFTEYLVDPALVQKVGQLGFMHGSGIHIVGRSYVSFKDSVTEKIPVYAPTDMTLDHGAYHKSPDAPEEHMPDYVMNFDAGCGVIIRIDHLKEVIPEIAAEFPELKEDSRTEWVKRIPFKAGDLIGYFIQNEGVTGIDFIVHDESITNQFANQARHESGYHKSLLLHAACPYDYYEEDKRKEYYALIGGATGQLFKNQECGPINRDFPGTISGQWFLDKDVSGGIYDYYMEGDYGSAFPIIGNEDRIAIGKINGRERTLIYPNYPTYKHPKDVTDEHCYQIHPKEQNPDEWDGYIYLKLVDDETMQVYYSATGDCPEHFPEVGFKTYYR